MVVVTRCINVKLQSEVNSTTVLHVVLPGGDGLFYEKMVDGSIGSRYPSTTQRKPNGSQFRDSLTEDKRRQNHLQ